MKFKSLFTLAVALALFAIVATAQGQVPKQINYQGVLTDDKGDLLTGNYSMTFAIYSVPTGGTPLWTETQGVTTSDGIFNVLLGSTTPIPIAVRLSL